MEPVEIDFVAVRIAKITPSSSYSELGNKDQKMLHRNRSMDALATLVLCLAAVPSFANLETTPYGKIVGIETRQQNLHIQTDFPAGVGLGCPVKVGDKYMYDFNAIEQGEGADTMVSVILAAFMAGKEVSFHLYKCNTNSTRPVVGHVRVR